MKKYSLKRINSQREYSLVLEDHILYIESSGEKSQCHFRKNGELIKAESNTSELALNQVALEALFSNNPEITSIHLNDEEMFSRETFFQTPSIWNAPTNSHLPIEEWMWTKDVFHPKRPAFKASQKLYSKYVGLINKTVSFRVIDENDLDIFHEWHNQPRVANFWELAKKKEELLGYIQKGLNDPHQMPVIAEIDGIPVGYFEIYWTKEDRLGPYYDSDAFDRGIHLLIGNTDYLGFNNTDAILKCVSHFIFLDDPRTRRIMGEPRHDNERMIRYIMTFKAWRKIKEFDFPHKRAALLECARERFFTGHYL